LQLGIFVRYRSYLLTSLLLKEERQNLHLQQKIYSRQGATLAKRSNLVVKRKLSPHTHMSLSQMSSDDMHQTIKAEMYNVLNEIAQAQGHRSAIGASPLDAMTSETAAMDRVQLLKERIATLEDALAKSETDRATTYMKLDNASRELQSAREDRLAMMHEYHDSNHGPVADAVAMLTAAQEDNHRLRHQLTLISERYDDEVPQLRSVVREQQLEIKRLKKTSKSSTVNGKSEAVTIADLHYSNERLSAQLSKLQAQAAVTARGVVDEGKFRELEEAVLSLTNETSALETKMTRMKMQHDAEKRELHRALEVTQREFEAERAECDKVVDMMAGKIKALMEQNQILQGICDGMSGGGGIGDHNGAEEVLMRPNGGGGYQRTGSAADVMMSSAAKRTPRR
jgi:chromosome segregation ATPase